MNRIVLLVLSASLVLVPSALASSPFISARSAGARPGEILVVLDRDLDLEVGRDARPRSRDAAIAGFLGRHDIDRARAVGPRSRADAGLRFVKLTSRRPDFDPIAAAAELRASGRVHAAIPNYRMRLGITIPNDPYVLPEQWYIQSTSDADVDLPEAWDVERGAASVVIGIADTGVDLGHPDLASKIWVNPDEVPGNFLDDDDNGYVDDVHGWDFGDDDGDPNPHPVLDAATEIDVAFHGTFVAGIAAAATNNAEGIAGAGWNSSVMALKVVNTAGEITSEALAGAFLYAAAERADVLNVSLGSYAEPGLPEFFQQLVDVCDSARVVCVASAGNDTDSSRVYPAAIDKVIAVAATDQSNYRTTFSNWGPWVDVAAPGTQMWSSIHRNYTVDEYSQIFYLYLFYWDGENPYMYGDGTSFASPLVAGTAALVRARWPGALGAEAMEAHLAGTGDDVAYDLPIGKKLNAFKAVTMAVDAPRLAPPGVAMLAPPSPNPFRGRVAIPFALATAAHVGLRIVDAQGRVVRTLAEGARYAGAHRADWDGRDAAGTPVGSGVYFVILDADGRRESRRIAYVR